MRRPDTRVIGALLLVLLSAVAGLLERRAPAWLSEDPLLRPFGREAPPDLRARLDSLLAGAAASPAPRMEPRVVDPDSATAAQWEALPGIGPKTAAAILALRDTLGGFTEPSDLLQVRGIGPKRLDALRPWLRWTPDPDSTVVQDASRP